MTHALPSLFPEQKQTLWNHLGLFVFTPECDCTAAVVSNNCQAIKHGVDVGCEARQVGSSHELLCV